MDKNKSSIIGNLLGELLIGCIGAVIVASVESIFECSIDESEEDGFNVIAI